jgi:hypothetical protein
MVAKLKVVEMVESGRLAWVADSLYMYVNSIEYGDR